MGTSPFASEKIAMLDEDGDEGLNEPAAKTSDDASGANARADTIPADKHRSEYVCALRRGEVRENLPLSPSLLFFEGVVRNRVPSPGRWMSKTSIASSNPQ